MVMSEWGWFIFVIIYIADCSGTTLQEGTFRRN